jgi:hypothetical protein
VLDFFRLVLGQRGISHWVSSASAPTINAFSAPSLPAFLFERPLYRLVGHSVMPPTALSKTMNDSFANHLCGGPANPRLGGTIGNVIDCLATIPQMQLP